MRSDRVLNICKLHRARAALLASKLRFHVNAADIQICMCALLSPHFAAFKHSTIKKEKELQLQSGYTKKIYFD